MGFPGSRALLITGLMGCLLATCRAQAVVVTVPTQSLEQMQQLTQNIDLESTALSAHANQTRVLLGAIEATMSRVVDSDHQYLVAQALSVPTLSLLQDVEFDQQQRTWTIKYSSMVMPDGNLNAYKRILYMSKEGNMNRGDTLNPCLSAGAGTSACVAALKTTYYVDSSATATQDSLSLDASFGGCTTCGIGVHVHSEPDSVQQTITITIPHLTVRNYLAKVDTHSSQVWGEQKMYTFGIGMLFVGAADSDKHVVISDVFSVIENNMEQVTLSKYNSYSIAKHFGFWTMKEVRTQIRVVFIDLLIEEGQEFHGLDVGINNAALPGGICATTQTDLDAVDSACMTTMKMCEPKVYTVNEGSATEQTWISVAYPVPAAYTMPLLVNLLVNTTDASSRLGMYSTINFQTHHEPQLACQDAHTATFTPVDYVAVEVLRGTGLVVETLDVKGTLQVHNTTKILTPSKGMAEALLTVVMRPKDESATAYFTSHPSDYIFLDNVYMSHARVDGVIPEDISNTITTGTDMRSQLTVDAALLQQCPLYSGDADQLGQHDNCVTTRDWQPTGGISRHTPPAHFVYEVDPDVGENVHKMWLQDNVVGYSDDASAVRDDIYARSVAKRGGHTKVYWILPLFHWSTSPLGLADTTILSLSWSVATVSTAAPSPAAPSPAARRLLGVPLPGVPPGWPAPSARSLLHPLPFIKIPVRSQPPALHRETPAWERLNQPQSNAVQQRGVAALVGCSTRNCTAVTTVTAMPMRPHGPTFRMQPATSSSHRRHMPKAPEQY